MDRSGGWAPNHAFEPSAGICGRNVVPISVSGLNARFSRYSASGNAQIVGGALMSLVLQAMTAKTVVGEQSRAALKRGQVRVIGVDRVEIDRCGGREDPRRAKDESQQDDDSTHHLPPLTTAFSGIGGMDPSGFGTRSGTSLHVSTRVYQGISTK